MITLSLSEKEYILLVLCGTAVGAAMAYVLLCRSLFTKKEVSYIKSDSTETCFHPKISFTDQKCVAALRSISIKHTKITGRGKFIL